jgi:hypothetical protein
MIGDELVPLNQLKSIDDALYQQAHAKYYGREFVTQEIIPGLERLWNDVIFMSAVPPASLDRALLNHYGQGLVSREFFEIDVTSLTAPMRVLRWFEKEGSKPDKRYEDFDINKMDEYAEIPNLTLEYFERMKAEEKEPLAWLFVPHILYQGRIPVECLHKFEV